MATRRARRIDRSIRNAIKFSEQSADSNELLSEILKVWGGPEKLAVDIKRAFDAAPDGSMIRQRYMEMIQRLVINNTKEEISNDIDPSEMSDEDLFEAANQLMLRIRDEGEEIDVDGEPEGSEEIAGDSAPDEQPEGKSPDEDDGDFFDD